VIPARANAAHRSRGKTSQPIGFEPLAFVIAERVHFAGSPEHGGRTIVRWKQIAIAFRGGGVEVAMSANPKMLVVCAARIGDPGLELDG
jgi:hypothetical protein